MEAKRPLNETSQRWNLNPRWKTRRPGGAERRRGDITDSFLITTSHL